MSSPAGAPAGGSVSTGSARPGSASSLPGEAEQFAARVRSYGLPVAGSMVEVPAAALRADRLAGVCDRGR
ncbi:hypothetical protein [Streptomyces sp. NPDC019890]|uniref:hypothetical protein n=1 Tax=Streptomyces sp. NPDC019890 TaxID=3365064 RepID=UPI00384F756A